MYELLDKQCSPMRIHANTTLTTYGHFFFVGAPPSRNLFAYELIAVGAVE